MLTQNIFFTITFRISPPPRFKRKSGCTPPPSDNPTLTNFFTRTEQDLTSVNTPCRKTYSNVKLQEKSALNNLKNNETIVITPQTM